MTSPQISVLMAVYNSDRFLKKTLDSILNQTWSDFELIIVNDGSTDRSLAILQDYAAKDARIQLISRENWGIPRTRNQLVAAATAELIAIMDADDVALPNRLAEQIAYLQQHPEVVCLGTAYELIDAKERLITQFAVPLEDADIQQQILAGHAAIFQPCAMMRRSAVLQVGGYDETMIQAEDLDLWLKLGEIGALANLPQVLMKYRLHSNSVSEQDCALQRQKALEACQRAWQRRGIKGHFEATEHWRPGRDRHSRCQFMLRYGWWAFNSRQRQTALIYSLKAIQAAPLSLAGWKLLTLTLLKPFPIG